MRVLVTGATGQVGRAICKYLSAGGHAVTGVSRTKPVAVELGSEGAVQEIQDLTPPCEAIVHAAASRSADSLDLSLSKTNCAGTQQVVELAEAWGVRQIVFISGITVIGRPLGPITEEHPVHPLNAYLASKLFGEHLMRIAETGSRRCATLRIPAPVGPGTPGNRILSVFVKRAMENETLLLQGSGTRAQNYLDVRDLGPVIETCLNGGASGLYNIAGSESIANADLARACIDVLGSSSTVGFSGVDDPEDDVVWDVSIAKAARDLAYAPRFHIGDSIRAIADEYSHRCSE